MIEAWKRLCNEFSPEQLANLLRRIAPGFRPAYDSLDFLINDDSFDKAVQTGIIELSSTQTIITATIHVIDELTARSGKRKQYDVAKRILKHYNHIGGIFAFYDVAGRFRLSLITVSYHGIRSQFSTYKRYTFFIDPELPNKTFLQQIQHADFSTLSGILETFSLEAVSDEFYKEFEPKYKAVANAVQGTDDEDNKHDLALLFIIRIIFLGFVQKKGWLGDNPRFLQDYWKEYLQTEGSDTFYIEWLEPLFFEALSSHRGHVVIHGDSPISKETRKALQMAPYLNGELFKRKRNLDDIGLWIPDIVIGDFFEFIFQYNFTVEENELYDEELELNPEFLGIIFERITNLDQGAVYTPRVEVDLMCRLALIKWLEQTTDIDKKDLYHLFFRDSGVGDAFDEHQKQGDFSAAEIRILILKLENVTICDPAAGSGAFEVGMLQVLVQILENLYSRNNTPEDLKRTAPDTLERKKAIIAQSLYGVEVKRWAVWINHLRLWLSLFVDMPDDYLHSYKPLLPNLTFKVRTGDSLVQRIGSQTFPLRDHAANLPSGLKHKITLLKQKKRDFFYNSKIDYRLLEKEELDIYSAILDAEIKEREEQIQYSYRHKIEQQTFIETDQEQMELDLNEETEALYARLSAEIDSLKEQKRNLKEARPFIWSIEFAEIFFDKGGFDIVIGNPPYIRHELINDPYGELDYHAYKDALLEMVRLDFPNYFAKSRSELDKFKTGRKPNGRSDLYAYFYIRSLRLLRPQGIHVFICSSSWLDASYGTWLQEFFLKQTPLYLVIDNHARRSFARADVNTVITVAGTPKKVNEDHTVRFIAFKKPFEDVVLSENIMLIDETLRSIRNVYFRVFPITTEQLLKGGSETKLDKSTSDNNQEIIAGTGTIRKYVGDKWGGKYLRAPDIFSTILEKGKEKLVPLGEIAKVSFGIKTGANDFFHLEPLGPGSRPGLLRVRNGAGWEGEVEEKFLNLLIKSPRECRGIVIKPEELKYRVFLCNKSKSELKGTYALEYIKWGEKQKYHLRPTTRSRSRWWDLGDKYTPRGIIPCSYRKSFRVYLNPNMVYTDKRLYEFYSKSDDVLLQLNSTLYPLFLEVLTRSYGGGGGPIDATVEEIESILVVKNVVFPINIIKELLNVEIQDIFVECGIDPKSEEPIADQEPNPLPIRKAIDDIIFNALGLTEAERKEVYQAVCQLAWERISKAGSVTHNG